MGKIIGEGITFDDETLYKKEENLYIRLLDGDLLLDLSFLIYVSIVP